MNEQVTFLLRTTLQVAVPLWIEKVRACAPEDRARTAMEMAETIAAHGDDLMFGGKRCAEAFNAVAAGLACLAFQPGGVTFLGDHWVAA